MKMIDIIGVLVILILTMGSANACDPSISLKKSANISTYTAVGQPIEYTYNVTNTGDVNIYDIYVVDNKLGNMSISNGPLEPNKSVKGTATYITKEEDLTNGSITNIAYAKGMYYRSGNKCWKESNEDTVKVNFKAPTAVPEFPTISLPVAAMLGLIFIFGRKKEE
ncbi:MAG: PEF-CTERM sorting domain-containing protein [Euryarchaeota archaeon]|nr:PEF-CTERM sorting domain-containing protein [Euryarchaeota archaeon]